VSPRSALCFDAPVLGARASGHQLFQQRHAALAGALEHAAGEQKQGRTVGAVRGDPRVVEVIPKGGRRGNRPERGDGVLVRARRRDILLVKRRRLRPCRFLALLGSRESRRGLASRSPRLLGGVQRRSPREVRSLLHLVGVQSLQVRRVRLHRLAHDAQLIPRGAAPRLRDRVLAPAGRPARRHRGRHRRGETNATLGRFRNALADDARLARLGVTRPRRQTLHRRERPVYFTRRFR